MELGASSASKEHGVDSEAPDRVFSSGQHPKKHRMDCNLPGLYHCILGAEMAMKTLGNKWRAEIGRASFMGPEGTSHGRESDIKVSRGSFAHCGGFDRFCPMMSWS